MAVDLVGAVAEHLVEDLGGERDEARVGDPGAVVAVVDLARLSSRTPAMALALRGIVVDGDQGGHAAHGGRRGGGRSGSAARVGAHEGHGHGDGRGRAGRSSGCGTS